MFAKRTIPPKFYKDGTENYPVVVETVGDLIDVLKELPEDFPVNQGYTDDSGAIITVFNVNQSTQHLQLQSIDEW